MPLGVEHSQWLLKKCALGCLHLQSGREMHEIKWRHIPEHGNIHYYRRENLKTYMAQKMVRNYGM
jgi:hypothetical protein